MTVINIYNRLFIQLDFQTLSDSDLFELTSKVSYSLSLLDINTLHISKCFKIFKDATRYLKVLQDIPVISGCFQVLENISKYSKIQIRYFRIFQRLKDSLDLSSQKKIKVQIILNKFKKNSFG